MKCEQYFLLFKAQLKIKKKLFLDFFISLSPRLFIKGLRMKWVPRDQLSFTLLCSLTFTRTHTLKIYWKLRSMNPYKNSRNWESQSKRMSKHFKNILTFGPGHTSGHARLLMYFNCGLCVVFFNICTNWLGDDIKSSKKNSILNQFKIARPPPSPSLS